MYAIDVVALDISGVTKIFVKSDGFRWPWRKRTGKLKRSG